MGMTNERWCRKGGNECEVVGKAAAGQGCDGKRRGWECEAECGRVLARILDFSSSQLQRAIKNYFKLIITLNYITCK